MISSSSSNDNICLIHLIFGVLLEDLEVGLQGLDLLLLLLLRPVVVSPQIFVELVLLAKSLISVLLLLLLLLLQLLSLLLLL